MKPIQEDIKDLLLESTSLALQWQTEDLNAWALYINEMPDKPNRVVAITADVPGQVVSTMGGFSELSDWERFTVLVRATKTSEAYEKAFEVVASLATEPSITINESRYHGFLKLNTISYAGRDESNRPLFTVGFRTLRHPAGR